MCCHSRANRTGASSRAGQRNRDNWASPLRHDGPRSFGVFEFNDDVQRSMTAEELACSVPCLSCRLHLEYVSLEAQSCTCNIGTTPDSKNEKDCSASGSDPTCPSRGRLALLLRVLVDVLLRALEDDLALGLPNLDDVKQCVRVSATSLCLEGWVAMWERASRRRGGIRRGQSDAQVWLRSER